MAMSEDEARAIAAPIAKRWGVLFYDDTHMICYESGDVLPIVDSEDVWCALMRAHGRVVELEAALVDLADADHPCTIQQALMDAGLVPEDGYCNCDDCTAYLRHKASRPPDTAGPQ
uniref:Uncharacterized protein n=1 Tax=viral metagenome TaxID=1070528 RepID=A0A6M3KQ90_9ZZZZ